tara:strand:- start:467 stop:640 length:174 start_codon:yes stop_codon:yes gene_type:complete
MKLQQIEITPEQIIAVNQAINLLRQRNDNRLVAVVDHLKKLAASMAQAKIIKGNNHE